MVFVPMSAPHRQQWRSKFGRGYMSVRYTHFCTFHESKRVRVRRAPIAPAEGHTSGPRVFPTPSHRPHTQHPSRCGTGRASTSARRNARDFPLLGATRSSITYKAIGNQDFVVPKEIHSSQGGSPYPNPSATPNSACQEWLRVGIFRCTGAMGYPSLGVIQYLGKFYQHQKWAGNNLQTANTFLRCLNVDV